MNKPKVNNNNALSRLRADYLRLKRDPVPYIDAEPLPSNILEWYYVVIGPERTPYEGGYYFGKLVFAREYPFKPPSIYIITPNGRFKTQTRLCLSISDFHPDTWNPAWNVSTILTGLLSFMLEKSPTLGSIETTDYEKKTLAAHSLKYNISEPHFIQLFPAIAEKMKKELEQRSQAERDVNNYVVESKAERQEEESYNEEAPKDNSQLDSFLINVFLFAGCAIFAYIVKYVILNV